MKPSRPWGWIAATVALVLFAAAVLGYAVYTSSKAVKPGNELPGVESFEFDAAEHVTSPVTYEQSPPAGGPHSPDWADCTGTVYPESIPNENAVHGLEHGAVWITYRPDLPAEQLAVLSELVSSTDFTMLSPYQGMDVPVSLQSWGRQLKLETFDEQKVRDFVKAYRLGPETPEPGATCSNPAFVGGS